MSQSAPRFLLSACISFAKLYFGAPSPQLSLIHIYHSLAQIDAHKNIITPDQYNKYRAEVKALRCLFYGELLDLFGRVPLVESDEVSLDKAKQVERGELFRFIVNELQSSLPFLADQRSNFEGEYYGRITRHVAEFMLARLMLNAEVYNDDNWIDGVRTLGSQILFNVDGQNMNAWEACIHSVSYTHLDVYKRQGANQTYGETSKPFGTRQRASFSSR